VGWGAALFVRLWLSKSPLPLITRLAGLGLASLALFWISYPHIF
jgi:hypothetical protein